MQCDPGTEVAACRVVGTGSADVWGLPLTPVTIEEAVAAIGRLVDAGQPSLVITPNLNYAMLTHGNAPLCAVNRRAALLLADGMPLVWASKRRKIALPERVAGSDLIFRVSALAAERGYRLFLLGGGPGVAETAARNLAVRYPNLQIAGTAVPPFRALSAVEHEALLDEIRSADADILITAFSQPRGEFWLDENLQALGVPVCIQLGAALDFAAARVRRAPRWLQKSGLEWAFRLALEPRRLARRYASNALFLARMVFTDLLVRSHAAGVPVSARSVS